METRRVYATSWGVYTLRRDSAGFYQTLIMTYRTKQSHSIIIITAVRTKKLTALKFILLINLHGYGLMSDPGEHDNEVSCSTDGGRGLLH
jgi:hypothetical protein